MSSPETITPRGTTVSFTAAELDWLAWVMQDVLAKYEHNDVSLSASNKVVAGSNLLAAARQAMQNAE